MGAPREMREPVTIDMVVDAPQGAESDPNFIDYSSSIETWLRTRLAPADASVPMARVSLTFVVLPLVEAAGIASSAAAPSTPSFADGGQCRLESPWVTVVAATSAQTLDVRVVWSERQFLVDQAVLGGATGGRPAATAPLRADEYQRFVELYVDEAVSKQEPRTDRLESAIPFDLLWLFRNSIQSTRGPFSGYASLLLKQLIQAKTSEYVRLTEALVDRCLTMCRGVERFESISQLRRIMDVDGLRFRTRS